MRSASIISSAVTASALFASSTFAQSWKTVPALEIKGQHFFYGNNGSEFFIRGVAYQQDISSNNTNAGDADAPTSYTDPLSNAANCARDIPYMLQLRTNTIRVYAVDPTQNHDECMQMLADAGIYVVADLGQPTQSINRDDPSWTGPLYQRYISVIDAFAKYNNVMGYFAGNEVSNSYNTTAASAFVKAAVRDSKAYIKQQNYRTVGVGYATYDGPIRDQLAQYFNCGDQSAAIDFWGYNVYSWCGDSNFVDSGYQARTQFFESYSVPVFMAEYGCNDVEPRPFTEVQAIFGPNMTTTWSGGIVYQYFQEANNYGLVSIDSSNSVSTLPDFNNLKSQQAMASPSSTAMSAYSPNFSPTSCPAVGTGTAAWMAQATPLPPTPNQALCSCEMPTLHCASSSNNATTYGMDFDYICGNNPDICDAIAHNATSGTYGAISVCNPKVQLSFLMNQYYLKQNSNPSACSFGGRASTQAAAAASGTCSSLVQAAGASGTGSVVAPSGNSQQQGGSSGASGSSTGKASIAASGPSTPFFSGYLQVGVYVLGALVTGVGMIAL